MVTLLALVSACSTGGKREPEPAATQDPEPTVSQPECRCEAEPTPEPVAAVPEPAPVPVPQVENMLTVGQVEYVILGDNLMQQRARIDTGATTSSLGAEEITLYERDGRRWARFRVRSRDTDETITLEAPLTRKVEIKRHNADPDERLAVNMPLTLGPLTQVVEVTLSNRDQFEFPVLIGRNFLDGKVVVDVSREFISMDNERTE